MRYALRTLRQNPGFALVAILSLLAGKSTAALVGSAGFNLPLLELVALALLGGGAGAYVPAWRASGSIRTSCCGRSRAVRR